MTKPSFDGMSVVATGVQTFSDRFGKRRRFDEDTPIISQWRCNLTGLSQVHNLYFIAYGKDIHVYAPLFPRQRIAERPLVTFTSQPSDNGLPGYLDPRDPHAINSLIVQHLGNEEVVAVVRDDGDVDAFLVRHVVQAIERRAEEANSIGVFADEIRPFFSSNVESSAWGLAIHSQARILATSSNKHEVRVFKFGLLDEDDDLPMDNAADPDTDMAEHEGNDVNLAHATHSRKQDVRLHVINGNTNIPYITFCNTGDDPEARWLLTTDIGGFCRAMDLHHSTAAQKFRFGQSFATGGMGGFDRLNAGWGIMFLDKRSFQPERSLNVALGLDQDESLPKLRDNPRVWDTSKTVQHIPDVSEPFLYHRTKRRERRPEPAEIRSPSASSDIESLEASFAPSGSSEMSAPAEIEIDLASEDNEEMDDDDDGGVDIEIEHGDDDGVDEAMDDNDDVMTVAPNAADDSDEEIDTWEVGIIDDDLDPDDEGTEDSIAFTSFYNGDSVCGNEPLFARLEDGGTLCDDLPCPILHASVRNIYLLQPSNQQVNPGPWVPPMVGLANPLRQPIQHDFEYLRMFERLNMHAQIPALGIVIVASQKGRALVLSLTKFSHKTAACPPEVSEVVGKKTNYGMRVECILPFAEQERRNERPFAPLHGLAVGPMQGCEGMVEEQKRWRVVMMYQDHSVLSYEISRRARGRDEGVDVGGLVV